MDSAKQSTSRERDHEPRMVPYRPRGCLPLPDLIDADGRLVDHHTVLGIAIAACADPRTAPEDAE